MRDYYVYIMTNRSGTLYTGVTNDIERRVSEHRAKQQKGFTKQDAITRLVYYEDVPSIQDAIAREKQIKGWRRSKKIALIAEMNPRWLDLAASWFEDGDVVAEG